MMTKDQLERAALIAESRHIDLATAQELVYLRDLHAAQPAQGDFIEHLQGNRSWEAQPAASTEAQHVTNAGDENVERWRSTMIDRDTTVATTPPDFTEQARQLVEGATIVCWKDHNDRYHVSDEVIERIAKHLRGYARCPSALAEAATQGQVVGLEMAASELDARYQRSAAHMKLNTQQDRAKNYGCWQDLTYAFKHAATAVRSLSPDPSYLDRVRNEAATAALEQAAQVARKYQDSNLFNAGAVKQAEHIEKGIKRLKEQL